MSEEEKIREWLMDMDCDNTAYFTGDTFITAILGITGEGAIAYSFRKMVDYLLEKDPDMLEIDAVEWLEYNTIRVIPYMQGVKPVIIDDFTIDLLK